MASSQYTKGLYSIISGSINLLTDNLKLVLVDTAGYTADFENDEFLDDIPSADRVATSPNLTLKTLSIETASPNHQVMFDCANGTFTAVSGDSTEAVVLYKDTGSALTSPLIAYYDGASVQLTPNGNDVNFTVSASGLLRWQRS